MTEHQTSDNAFIEAFKIIDPSKIMKLYFDGAYQYKTGISGAGAKIEAKNFQFQVIRQGKCQSPMIAEYTSLALGLEVLIRYSVSHSLHGFSLLIRGDGQQVIDQLFNRPTTAAKLLHWRNYVRQLLDLLRRQGVSIDARWIPRAQNQDADHLSKRAIHEPDYPGQIYFIGEDDEIKDSIVVNVEETISMIEYIKLTLRKYQLDDQPMIEFITKSMVNNLKHSLESYEVFPDYAKYR